MDINTFYSVNNSILDERITVNIESKLDEADLQAKTDSTRYTHEEVFSPIRNQINTK